MPMRRSSRIRTRQQSSVAADSATVTATASTSTPPTIDGTATPERQPDAFVRSSSPLQCSICLSEITNKSFTDTCFHEFCFECLCQWAKHKPECPLCKKSFAAINHTMRGGGDYDTIYVRDLVPLRPAEDDVGRSFFMHLIDDLPTATASGRWQPLASSSNSWQPTMSSVWSNIGRRSFRQDLEQRLSHLSAPRNRPTVVPSQLGRRYCPYHNGGQSSTNGSSSIHAANNPPPPMSESQFSFSFRQHLPSGFQARQRPMEDAAISSHVQIDLPSLHPDEEHAGEFGDVDMRPIFVPSSRPERAGTPIPMEPPASIQMPSYGFCDWETITARSRQYTSGRRTVLETALPEGRLRSNAASFYRNNVAQLDQQIQFIVREVAVLNVALLGNNIGDRSSNFMSTNRALADEIRKLMLRFNIRSENFMMRFEELVSAYLMPNGIISDSSRRYFRHFVHELYCFTLSPYSMSEFDRHSSVQVCHHSATRAPQASSITSAPHSYGFPRTTSEFLSTQRWDSHSDEQDQSLPSFASSPETGAEERSRQSLPLPPQLRIIPPAPEEQPVVVISDDEPPSPVNEEECCIVGFEKAFNDRTPVNLSSAEEDDQHVSVGSEQPCSSATADARREQKKPVSLWTKIIKDSEKYERKKKPKLNREVTETIVVLSSDSDGPVLVEEPDDEFLENLDEDYSTVTSTVTTLSVSNSTSTSPGDIVPQQEASTSKDIITDSWLNERRRHDFQLRREEKRRRREKKDRLNSKKATLSLLSSYASVALRNTSNSKQRKRKMRTSSDTEVVEVKRQQIDDNARSKETGDMYASNLRVDWFKNVSFTSANEDEGNLMSSLPSTSTDTNRPPHFVSETSTVLVEPFLI